ncbi:MAG: rplF [Geobacteraceae bacterium]|jgi:large subunit ribosomal protein L6|nr:rplF [Geobacteraceae bacterium]
MSRIGKLPIEIPSGVTVTMNGSAITVKGPKGTLTRNVMDSVSIELNDNKILVTRSEDTKIAHSAHGLTRTLINNMVTGVTKGFEKVLEITGVGYRAEVKGNVLSLALGYSHPVNYELPQGISVEVDKMTKISLKGNDRELVGQTAAKIRSFRTPEPYKGKGIKYAGETILRKAGKAGKK